MTPHYLVRQTANQALYVIRSNDEAAFSHHYTILGRGFVRIMKTASGKRVKLYSDNNGDAYIVFSDNSVKRS